MRDWDSHGRRHFAAGSSSGKQTALSAREILTLRVRWFRYSQHMCLGFDPDSFTSNKDFND